MSAVHTAPPFIHSGDSTPALMRLVLLSLLPGLVVKAWFSGPSLLLMLLFVVIAALLLEAACVSIRGRAPLAALGDGSALLSALLLTLSLPAETPWWTALAAIAFAIVLVKQAFGGLGQNLFNPAMAGYAFALLAFPTELGVAPGADGMAAATPALQASGAVVIQVTAGQLLALAYLAGALVLLFRGVIAWLIPAAVILGATLSLLPLAPGQAAGNAQFMLLQLLSPGLVLAAFYLATDPVTAPVTARARLVYGILIGALIVLIRQGGLYTEGVAFAIVMGNFFTPLLDRLLRPRRLGRYAANNDEAANT